MHLCNRTVPRLSGSEQASNAENANEQQSALPTELECWTFGSTRAESDPRTRANETEYSKI